MRPWEVAVDRRLWPICTVCDPVALRSIGPVVVTAAAADFRTLVSRFLVPHGQHGEEKERESGSIDAESRNVGPGVLLERCMTCGATAACHHRGPISPLVGFAVDPVSFLERQFPLRLLMNYYFVSSIANDSKQKAIVDRKPPSNNSSIVSCIVPLGVRSLEPANAFYKRRSKRDGRLNGYPLAHAFNAHMSTRQSAIPWFWGLHSSSQPIDRQLRSIDPRALAIVILLGRFSQEHEL